MPEPLKKLATEKQVEHTLNLKDKNKKIIKSLQKI